MSHRITFISFVTIDPPVPSILVGRRLTSVHIAFSYPKHALCWSSLRLCAWEFQQGVIPSGITTVAMWLYRNSTCSRHTPCSITRSPCPIQQNQSHQATRWPARMFLAACEFHTRTSSAGSVRISQSTVMLSIGPLVSTTTNRHRHVPRPGLTDVCYDLLHGFSTVYCLEKSEGKYRRSQTWIVLGHIFGVSTT